MTTETRKVLVTRDRIDETAVDLLAGHGLDCIFSPPYTPPEEVVETARAANISAIMVSQGRITDAVIGASPALRVIAKHGSGVNNINLRAAERRGIPVYRAVGANALAVAEHALTLMLALRKSLPMLDTATRGGTWLKGSFVGQDLAGTRVGLFGLGEIGRETARLAAALGMQVMAYDPALSPDADLPFEVCTDPDDMIRRADILSLHCPLVPATRNLVDRAFLERMQPHAVLVNTARGGIVDEDALAEALIAGRIAGAALDSYAEEPPAPGSRIWSAPNLIATPHAAGLTPGAERAMATMAARFIIDALAGTPVPDAFRADASALGGLTE